MLADFNMLESRASFYRFIIIISLMAYVWVGYNLISLHQSESPSPSVCLMKHTTGVPCPFCGSTRSVMEIAHGHFVQSLLVNPLGAVVVLIVVVCPLWLLADIILKKQSLYNAYRKASPFFSKRKTWLIIILLIIANWIWNIQKGV